MAIKTWFQHDINCSEKDGLSNLIAEGGFEAYGRFWAFIELFHFMQLHRVEKSEKININERTILKRLQMNRKSLPKLMELFHESLGIVFQKLPGTCSTVWETTIPKSLDYIEVRSSKADNKIEKESKKKKEKKRSAPVPVPPVDVTFDKFVEMRKKIKKPLTDYAVKLAKNKLSDMAGKNTDLMIKIIEQSVLKCWQDFYPLKSEGRQEQNKPFKTKRSDGLGVGMTDEQQKEFNNLAKNKKFN